MARKKYTKEERNELALRAKNGDVKARNEIIPAMEGLVVMLSAKARKWSGDTLSFNDLKAQGWIAVFECIQAYDENRPGADFGGMCGYRIRQQLEVYARDCGMVRPIGGVRIRLANQNIRRVISEYEASGLSTEQALREASRMLNITESEAIHLLNGRNTVTIGFQEGEHEPVDEAGPALEEIAEKEVPRIVNELLSVLSESERSLVLQYIEGRTFESIAAERGMSRERWRQRFNVALEKLRAEADRRGLSLSDIL